MNPEKNPIEKFPQEGSKYLSPEEISDETITGIEDTLTIKREKPPEEIPPAEKKPAVEALEPEAEVSREKGAFYDKIIREAEKEFEERIKKGEVPDKEKFASQKTAETKKDLTTNAVNEIWNTRIPEKERKEIVDERDNGRKTEHLGYGFKMEEIYVLLGAKIKDKEGKETDFCDFEDLKKTRTVVDIFGRRIPHVATATVLGTIFTLGIGIPFILKRTKIEFQGELYTRNQFKNIVKEKRKEFNDRIKNQTEESLKEQWEKTKYQFMRNYAEGKLRESVKLQKEKKKDTEPEKREREYDRIGRQISEFKNLWELAQELAREKKDLAKKKLLPEIHKEELAIIDKDFSVLSKKIIKLAGEMSGRNLIEEAKKELNMKSDPKAYEKEEFKNLLTKKAKEIYEKKSGLYNTARRLLKGNLKTGQIKKIINEARESGKYGQNGEKINGRLILAKNGKYYFEIAGKTYPVVEGRKIAGKAVKTPAPSPEEKPLPVDLEPETFATEKSEFEELYYIEDYRQGDEVFIKNPAGDFVKGQFRELFYDGDEKRVLLKSPGVEGRISISADEFLKMQEEAKESKKTT